MAVTPPTFGEYLKARQPIERAQARERYHMLIGAYALGFVTAGAIAYGLFLVLLWLGVVRYG
jgi:hypothetical protein